MNEYLRRKNMRDGLLYLSVFVIGILFLVAASSSDGAEARNARGVIALERVVELPDDSEKWYLSIVGEYGEARYTEILLWFEKDSALNQLRKQVHFRMIDSDTSTYRKRYAQNVKGLPTVRLQKHNGVVVYESAGDNLPLSAGGLYGAIANSASKAQGLGIFRPWGPRKQLPLRAPGPLDPLDYRCPNRKCPRRPVEPPEDDPPPAPLVPGGPPEIAVQSGLDMPSAGIGAGSVLLCLFGGAGASLFVQWRKMYRQ